MTSLRHQADAAGVNRNAFDVSHNIKSRDTVPTMTLRWSTMTRTDGNHNQSMISMISSRKCSKHDPIKSEGYPRVPMDP